MRRSKGDFFFEIQKCKVFPGSFFFFFQFLFKGFSSIFDQAVICISSPATWPKHPSGVPTPLQDHFFQGLPSAIDVATVNIVVCESSSLRFGQPSFSAELCVYIVNNYYEMKFLNYHAEVKLLKHFLLLNC